MNYKEMLEKVEVLVSPILENLGFELIEKEFGFEQGRSLLRLYINREGGNISIADCETASRAIDTLLEVENIIQASYSLEVSSPGLDRPLRRRQDFERFKGSRISIKTLYPIEGRHNFATVELKGLQEDKIKVQDGNREWLIPLEAIKKAKLKPA